MRKSTTLLLVSAAFLLALVSLGCNGSTAGDHPISITLAPISPQMIDGGQTLLITAAVAFDPSNRGVGWALQGPGMLENRTTTTVTYQSPSLTAATPVTITASSLTDTNVKAAITINVNPFAIPTTALPDGTIGVPYTVALQVNGGIPPLTWSISSGSLPGWANLDSSTGLISGTPDMSATSNFTVEVTDSSATPVSVTRALSITVAAPSTVNDSALNGQYAFLLQGFDDATGNQSAIVGSFIADGHGNITGGIEDLNGPDGYKPAVTFTGRYSIGADNRGYATFTNSLAATTTFAFSVGGLNASNVATGGSMIEFDDITGTNGRRGTGALYLQDSATFNLASINGPYAFQMVGQSSTAGSRQVTAGVFTSDGKGNMTDGDAQVVTGPAGDASQSAFTGTISTTSDTSHFGRVMWDVTLPGGSVQRISYIVNSGHALLLTTGDESTTNLLSGQVMAQSSIPFAAASLKGTSVEYSVGLSAIVTGHGAVSAGLWDFDGAGAVSFSADHNDSKTVSSGSGSLSYTVAANGRVELLDESGDAVTVAYLVDQDKGFFVNLDSSASAGSFEPQTGGPFSNASISGAYAWGTVPAAVTGSGVAVGTATSSGDGALNVTFDSSDPIALLAANQTVTLNVTIDSNGRATDTEELFIYYVVSPEKTVLMNITSLWPTISIIQQ